MKSTKNLEESLKGEILMQFGVKTGKKRIYQRKDITRIRERFNIDSGQYENYTILKDIQKKSKGKMLIGEYGYGATSNISLINVSHYIMNIRIEEDYLVGDVIPLKTGVGQVLISSLHGGEDIVFRPRAIGAVNEYGHVSIDELFTFDAITKSNDAWNITDKNFIKRRLLTEKEIF